MAVNWGVIGAGGIASRRTIPEGITMAKEMVKAGLLGKIVLGRAQLSCWYPEIKGAWRQDPKLSGGGSFIDMGNHCIDLLEFILDSRVKEVACFTDRLVQGYQVEDGLWSQKVVLACYKSALAGKVAKL